MATQEPITLQVLMAKLDELEHKLSMSSKSILTADEAADYLGISVKTIYNIAAKIRHYKPNGKTLYFDKSDLDAFMHTNPVASDADIAEAAAIYCDNH